MVTSPMKEKKTRKENSDHNNPLYWIKKKENLFKNVYSSVSDKSYTWTGQIDTSSELRK